MKFLSVIAALLAAFVSTSVWADFDPESTSTLKMTTKDSNYRSSFTNAASWTAKSGVTRVAPQLMEQNTPPNPAAADFDYYVPADMTIRTLKDYRATVPYIKFGGRSLHVAGTFQAGNNYANYPIGGIDLHFLAGSTASLNATLGVTNCTISVETTQSKPLTIKQSQGSDVYSFVVYDSTLVGAETAWIRLAGGTEAKGPVKWYYRGDGSGYRGTIELDATKGYNHALTLSLGRDTSLENAAVILATNATLSVDELTGSVVKIGTVTVSANGQITLPTTATIEIGSLCLPSDAMARFVAPKLKVGTYNLTDDIAGGTLSVPAKATLVFGNVGATQQNPLVFAFAYDTEAHTNGQVIVNGTFTGPATIRLDSDFANDCFKVPVEQVLLRIAKNGNTKPEVSAFVLDKPNGTSGLLPTATIRVDESETTWDVVLQTRPVVRQKEAVINGDLWNSAEKATKYWDDGEVPSKDKDYYVDRTFYTCNGTSTSRCEFDMHSLTIGGSSFWVNHATMVFPEVTQLLAGEITSSSNADLVFTNGCFFVPNASGNTNLRPYGWRGRRCRAAVSSFRRRSPAPAWCGS